jgi:hypothetical protein
MAGKDSDFPTTSTRIASSDRLGGLVSSVNQQIRPIDIALTQFYVAATARLLGRKTAGAGAAEEMTQADVATFLGMSANGLSLVQAANYAAMLTALGLSANGASLVTAADYAAMRALLGLVIGTNVQAWDADLDTWATKTAPSGTVVGTSDTQTLTAKRVNPRVVTLTDAATVTPNADTTDEGILTSLSQATALATPSGTPVDGQKLIIRVKSSTARVITPDSGYRGSVDLPFATFTTSGSSLTDYLMFIYNSADSKWDLMAKTAGF